MRIKGSEPDELNYIVPVSNGILRPPHLERIGPALGLFLVFEDMVTTAAEDGKTGLVWGGQPVTDAKVAKRMGVHAKTVGEWRGRLAEHGYIELTRVSKGMIVRVKKSKKVVTLKLRAERLEVKRDKKDPDKPPAAGGCDGCRDRNGWVETPAGVVRCKCRE